MKKVLSLIVVLMLVVVLVGCGKKKAAEAKGKGFTDEYKEADLVFKNANISAHGEYSIITSTLTNTSEEDKQIGMVKLTVTYTNTSNNENTTEFLIYFGDKIEGNQTLQTETMLDFNTNNITKVEYEFVQK